MSRIVKFMFMKNFQYNYHDWNNCYKLRKRLVPQKSHERERGSVIESTVHLYEASLNINARVHYNSDTNTLYSFPIPVVRSPHKVNWSIQFCTSRTNISWQPWPLRTFLTSRVTFNLSGQSISACMLAAHVRLGSGLGSVNWLKLRNKCINLE